MAILTAVWQFLKTNAAPTEPTPPAPTPRAPRLTLVPRAPAVEMRLQGDKWIPRPPGRWPAEF
jgi:hypothetical protein